MWLMIGGGAIGAGLFLMLREFLPWVEARRTGRVRRKGARAQIVTREAEPERFEALLQNRLKAAGSGALLILGGLGWLAWNALGLVASVSG